MQVQAAPGANYTEGENGALAYTSEGVGADMAAGMQTNSALSLQPRAAGGQRGGALVAFFDKLVRGIPRSEIRVHLDRVLEEGAAVGQLPEQV